MSLSLPLVLAAALLSAAPSGPRRVAVLDFNARWASRCGDANLTDAQEERCEALRLFADQARGGALAVLRPPTYVVMTRENTAQILKDMGGQCTEGECEVETARLLGASVVVSGEVTYMEGTWLVSIKVHDVATAALLGTGNTEGKSKLEAFRNVRAETQRMLKEAVGLDGVGAAPSAAAASKPVEPPKPAPPQAPKADPAGALSRVVEKTPATSPEPGVRSGPELKRWFGEGRVGFARLLGGYATPSKLDPVQLQDFGVGAGYRLSRQWSFLAAGGLHPSSTFFAPGAIVSNQLDAEAYRFSVGAAWSPGENRYFSIAPELGVLFMKVDLTLGWTGTSGGQSKVGPLVGVELRFDYPLGDSWYVGARVGAKMAFLGFDLTVADVFETISFKNDKAFVPLNAALGYRF